METMQQYGEECAEETDATSGNYKSIFYVAHLLYLF